MSFHCFPGGKSVEVTFQPFKRTPFRYQYPDEDWKDVLNGETYTIEPVNPGFDGGQCAASYRVLYQRGHCRRGQFRFWSSTSRTSEVTGPILEVFARTSDGAKIELPTDPCDRTFKQIKILTADGEKKGTGFLAGTYTGIRILGVIRTDEQPDDCGNPPNRHHFKVFNASNELIFERIDDDFPEVEEPVCLRDETLTKRYELNFRPSVLFITDTAPPLRPAVPESCLHVYALRLLKFEPGLKNPLERLEEEILDPDQPWDGLDLVCSDKGCPVPVYDVDCDPDKKCPEETCFECEHEGTVCCFGEPDKDGFHQVIYSYRK